MENFVKNNPRTKKKKQRTVDTIFQIFNLFLPRLLEITVRRNKLKKIFSNIQPNARILGNFYKQFFVNQTKLKNKKINSRIT